MKRVLLTGGAGSIGTQVLYHIMETTDWEVVVLDSFRHKGYKERLGQLFYDMPLSKTRVSTYQHDLVCPLGAELMGKIGHIDYVLHLAAMSDVFFSTENPPYVIHNNVISTLNMLEYAKQIDHEAFVYFSTDEVYGPVSKGEAHPEWDAHRPSNPYSASKAASEDICYCYWRAGDVKLIITNTMNNFSPMQSGSKFPVMVQKAVENSETVIIHGNETEIGTRFYIHSRNVADALVFILEQGAYEHQVGELDDPFRYHIVGEKCLSNLELAQSIADIMGKPLKYELQDFHKDNPAHDIHYGLEDNYLRSKGWVQPASYEDSMRATIEWQKKHSQWME